MFRDPIRIRRPGLRDEVLALVRRVCAEPGEQCIRLDAVVASLGVRLAPWLREELAQRGELVLGPHRFTNRGPPVRRRVKLLGFGVDLAIPSDLEGGITRFRDGFQLTFDAGRSISVERFLFGVELRHLDFSGERIFVDFAAAQDIFIELT